MAIPNVAPVEKKPTKKAESAPPVLEKVFITKDNTFEDVLRFVQQGTTVYFDDAPGKLLVLSDEQVKELPSLERVKYDQARVNHDRLSKEDPAWIEVLRRIQVKQADYASPMDKIEGNIPKPGLVKRNARIDKVDYWRKRGFEVAQPDHLADAKMRKVEGHYEVSRDGQVESVLMVTTQENWDSLMAQRAARKKRKIEAVSEAQERNLQNMGYKTVK